MLLTKPITPLLFLFCLFACRKDQTSTQERQALLQNGTLSTGIVSASGMPSPTGTTWSELQAIPGSALVNTSIGFSCHYGAGENFRIADDFSIPLNQEWHVSKISVYALHDAYASGDPFDGLHLQIWRGKPSQPGSKLVYGDLATNSTLR